MNSREWKEFIEDAIRHTEGTLIVKGEVYSVDYDRLGNFKRAGEVLGVSSPQALMGIASKHLVKTLDIVKMYEDGGIIPTKEQSRETFGDLRNYLYLLEALFLDIRREKLNRQSTPHLLGVTSPTQEGASSSEPPSPPSS